MILGAFWGLGEFAYIFSSTMALVTETGCVDPKWVAWGPWLASYIILWVLMESLVATIVVMIARLLACRRHNDPVKAET